MKIKLNNDEIKFDFSFFESDESLLNLNYTNIKIESRKRAKTKVQVLSAFLFVIFFLANYSTKTKYISLLIFANNDYKRCTLLNKLDLYKYNIRYIFLFFMYSYLNIYSTFAYLVLDVLTNILNDILRLLYFDSRPFWDDNSNVFPCICEFTPSQPSHTANNSFLFLCLYYFLKKEERAKNTKKFSWKNKKNKNRIYVESEDENSELKDDNSNENLSNSQFYKSSYSNICSNFFFVFLIILILFVDTIPLLQNIEYLHQTLFGLSLGFSLYYWVFNIVKVNHLNRKQFLKIINQPLIILTFSMILIIIILSVHNRINKRILTSQIIQIQKFCEIPKDLNFSKEILKNVIQLFEILGAYSGLLLEYKVTFNSSDVKFTLYNVNSKNKEKYNDDESGIKKLIRFLLLYFIEIVFFKTIIEFWVKHNLKGWIEIIILSLSYFFKGIFFFYFMKIILSKVKLTNNKIFEETDEQ